MGQRNLGWSQVILAGVGSLLRSEIAGNGAVHAFGGDKSPVVAVVVFGERVGCNDLVG